MTKRLLKQLLKRRSSSTSGFTLLELLIVSLIAGVIISGLMFLVVQLLSTDQQDAARNDTQRDMQNALDYIAADLREAVFVYPGRCLENRSAAPANGADCPGLPAYLPTAVSTNSVPVLAFWKPQPFPTRLQELCATSTVTAPYQVGGQTVPCSVGTSYALVVYSLSTNNPGTPPTWRGEARITRYMLQEFSVSGTTVSRTAGYVNPSNFTNNFMTWPFYPPPAPATGFVNMQAARPDGPNPVLVDFVDDGQADAWDAGDPNANPIACPDDTRTPLSTAAFTRSPSNAALTGTLAGARSFHACVSTAPQGNTGEYQEVILFLRGNAKGKPAVPFSRFLPTLETRVLSRGVLQRNPPN